MCNYPLFHCSHVSHSCSHNCKHVVDCGSHFSTILTHAEMNLFFDLLGIQRQYVFFYEICIIYWTATFLYLLYINRKVNHLAVYKIHHWVKLAQVSICSRQKTLTQIFINSKSTNVAFVCACFSTNVLIKSCDLKVSFYFHVIPRNDLWWQHWSHHQTTNL